MDRARDDKQLAEGKDVVKTSARRKHLPHDWLHCPKMGHIIANKFLPFKTPLDARYDSKVREVVERFGVKTMIEMAKAQGLKVGMVVDLTYTDRYYRKEELETRGVSHRKLKCIGYDAAPDSGQVKTFIAWCDEFFHLHPGEIIGVHCTHGFNRTGFLIIAYLIEKETLSFRDAMTAYIEEFGVQSDAITRTPPQARPPGIYKGDYLDELAQRYNGGQREAFETPALPEWCYDRQKEAELGSCGNCLGTRNAYE